MNAEEFRNSVFAILSKEGFVKSYKTQLRTAIHKYATENREFVYPAYQHSLKSELICNIIADYLEKYRYRSTLHVFEQESAYHRIPNEDIMRQVQLTSKNNCTVLESLMRRRNRAIDFRSFGCQTTIMSMNERLALIDNTKGVGNNFRFGDRKQIVEDRLAEIRKEKESEFEEKVTKAFDALRLVELSRAKMEASARFQTEIQRMKDEYNAIYLERSNELKLAREHEQETMQLMENELEKRLASLKMEKAEEKTQEDPEIFRKQCNRKLNKMLKDAQKLVAQKHKLKEEMVKEQEEYQKTMKTLLELRQQFASIHVN